MTNGSSALSILAKDAEDAATKATEFNSIERAHKHTIRLSEIKQLEATNIESDEIKDFKAA